MKTAGMFSVEQEEEEEAERGWIVSSDVSTTQLDWDL